MAKPRERTPSSRPKINSHFHPFSNLQTTFDTRLTRRRHRKSRNDTRLLLRENVGFASFPLQLRTATQRCNNGCTAAAAERRRTATTRPCPVIRSRRACSRRSLYGNRQVDRWLAQLASRIPVREKENGPRCEKDTNVRVVEYTRRAADGNERPGGDNE